MPNFSSLAGLEVPEKFVVEAPQHIWGGSTAYMGGEHVTTMSNSNASCFRVALSWVELRWVLTKGVLGDHPHNTLFILYYHIHCHHTITVHLSQFYVAVVFNMFLLFINRWCCHLANFLLIKTHGHIFVILWLNLVVLTLLLPTLWVFIIIIRRATLVG